MAIERIPGGGTAITGARDVHLYRLLTIKQGLELEIATNGRMRLTRGPKMTTILRREYGITGNRQTQLAKLKSLIEQYEAARLDQPPEQVAQVKAFPNVGGAWGGR